MRVVLDTSAVVAAFLNPRGPAGELLAEVRRRHRLLLSPPIIVEYAAVLQMDDFAALGTPKERLRLAQSLASERMCVLVRPRVSLEAMFHDPDDACFLEAAVAGRAALVVSRETRARGLVARLQVIPAPPAVEPIPVVDPTRALAALRSARPAAQPATGA